MKMVHHHHHLLLGSALVQGRFMTCGGSMSLVMQAASQPRILLFRREERIGTSIIGGMCFGWLLGEWCWQDGVGSAHVIKFMQFMGRD
jgi:hypothetical protein